MQHVDFYQAYVHFTCPVLRAGGQSCCSASGFEGRTSYAHAGISQSLTAAKGELYRQSDQSQQTLPWTNYSQIDPNSCPPILCKLHAMTTAACNAYKVNSPLACYAMTRSKACRSGIVTCREETVIALSGYTLQLLHHQDASDAHKHSWNLSQHEEGHLCAQIVGNFLRRLSYLLNSTVW